MNKKLTEKLYKKYPKIFIQKDLGPRKSAMCFGLECGDGWYNLIDKLCYSLQFDTDKNSYQQVEAVQVKEKFGGLRFYTNCKDDFLRGHIAFAEVMSTSICETCGLPGKTINIKSWMNTICKKCLKQHNK